MSHTDLLARAADAMPHQFGCAYLREPLDTRPRCNCIRRELEAAAAPSPTGWIDRELAQQVVDAVVDNLEGEARRAVQRVLAGWRPSPTGDREREALTARFDVMQRPCMDVDDDDALPQDFGQLNDYIDQLEALVRDSLAASPSPTGGEPDAREWLNRLVAAVERIVQMHDDGSRDDWSHDEAVDAFRVAAHRLAELLPAAPTAGEGETGGSDREIYEATIAEVARDLEVASAPELRELYEIWLAATGDGGAKATCTLQPDVNVACYAIYRLIKLKTALRGAGASRRRWRDRALAAPAGEGDDAREDGVSLIAAERRRQVDEEGYDAAHDDRHGNQSIAWAAVVLAAPDTVLTMPAPTTPTRTQIPALSEPEPGWGPRRLPRPINPNDLLPAMDDEDDDQTGPAVRAARLRELAQAGALIAAEIDRIRRAELLDAEAAADHAAALAETDDPPAPASSAGEGSGDGDR